MPLDFNDGETEQWKSTNRGGMACKSSLYDRVAGR